MNSVIIRMPIILWQEFLFLDSSKELKQKVRMCMRLRREYDAYQNYYKMKMYLESLDSLIGGIRLYDANKAKSGAV